MSIIEVVIAFVVLMVVLVPIALLLFNTIGQAATARERLTALSLAEQYVDLLNNTPLDGTHNTTPSDTSLPVTNDTIEQTTAPIVRSTVSYSVYARFTWALHEASTPDLCTSGTAPTLLDLQVTVEWGLSKQKIADTTMIEYPPSGILTDGFLAIKVDGDPVSGPPDDAHTHAWKTRVRAVPVTIEPGSTVTGYTTVTRYPNEYGCVFEEVPPGNYTISVGDPSPGIPTGTDYGTPSWVANYDEELTEKAPSQSTVTVGDVTTVAFTYDEGSLVDVTYPSTTVAEGDVTCPGVGSILCMAAGQSPATAVTPEKSPKADISLLTSSGWTLYQPSATRLTATACAGSTRCISVGYKQTGSGFAGASVSTPTSAVQFSTDSVPSGVTAIDGITCPSSSRCYAYGEDSGSSSAVILSAAVGTAPVAWSLDGGLAGVATVSALSCPSSGTCYALGSTSSGEPTIVSLAATGGAWTTDTLPTTPSNVTTVSELACRSTSCFALGSSSTGASVLSLSATSATTWIEDTLPTATALTQVACPSANHCYAIGSESSSTSIVVSLSSVTATTVKWTTNTLPSSISALSLLVCPATSTCYATGSSATGPAVVSLLATTDTWTTDSLPTGMDSVSDLVCPSASKCAATGTATVGGSARAVILSLSSPTAWTEDTLSSSVVPVYFAGIACTATGPKCAAPGASTTGSVFLSATLTSQSWTEGTETGLVGMSLDETPVSVYNADLSPSTTLEVVAPASGDVSDIGPLFPFTSGYEIAATECAPQVTSTATAVSSVPGGTATSTLAMGLLPVEVESTSGAPVAGATVTATPTCTPLTPLDGSNRTKFTLEPTGPFGTSETAVMYGTYQITATSGSLSAKATVTVTKTDILVSGVADPLPSPVVVKL